VLGSAAELADLRTLAAGADVVTFDHEGVPPEVLATLAADGVPLAPSPEAQLMAQDKLHARVELGRLGFPVPPFVHARTPRDVAAFAAEHGWPVVGKLPRGGYDGRGVAVLDGAPGAAELLRDAPAGIVVEPHLALDRELAVLVARSTSGEAVAYPVVETVQRDGMCREILFPAPIDPLLADEAHALALSIAEEIGATGVLAVELFVSEDRLLVNELALRPHNSGHWTIEGASTSQFEQHLRAVLGWPLGDTDPTAPAVATINVVGPPDGTDPATRVAVALGVPGARVHLYGKAARPGRKLGHVTVRGDDPAAARARALQAAALLEGRDS
jgi:5-(carboxyamino)imidazole ribonucleotide synthase